MTNTQEAATLDATVAKWLETERRIPVEVAARCGVVTINGKPAFEYRRDGRLQYRKMRIEMEDGGKSFARDRKGAEACLFLEHTIQDDPDLSSPLVICEGEIDALSLVASGVANAVSVPDGAQLDQLGQGKIVPADDKAFGWLWDDNGLKPHLAQFERVVLVTDNDRKGRILREELAVRFERWRCDVVDFPADCKDANDVLVKHGPATLHEVVSKARPLVPNKLVPFSQITQYGTGEIFSSGIAALDDGLKFNFVPPELVVITGAPGSGKSEFAVALGANLARIHNLPGAILQFEDRSVRVRDTLLRYAMCNVNEVQDRTSASRWVDQWFRTIEPEQNLSDDVDYDLDWLRTTLRESRTRHGCRWVILDPWNELDHIWDRSMNESQYVNDALRKLKRMARALGLILMVVVHPSKEGGRGKDITERDLYDVAGSAAWANKADHGFVVHRPDQGKADVYVKLAKSKDHSCMGVPGIAQMHYVPGAVKYRLVRMGV